MNSNPLSLGTLNAYRDQGRPEPRLEQDLARARLVMERLPAPGIRLDQVTGQLEEEGVEKFKQPHDRLPASPERKVARCSSPGTAVDG